MQSFSELFEETLKGIYYAEKAISEGPAQDGEKG
jgi:ferritin-like metal-binding protein YciE